MTAYRRNFVPGGCFFFTINLAERRLALLTDHIEVLRGGFAKRVSAIHSRSTPSWCSLIVFGTVWRVVLAPRYRHRCLFCDTYL